MFDQTTGASGSSSNQLIPHGTLAFAAIKVTGVKKSKRTGGEYANLELTITEGEYQRRKVWTVIMNPQDPANMDDVKRAEGKPDGAKMGLVALTRIFEAAGVFTNDPRSYQKFNGATFVEILQHIEGLTAGIKVKVAKGGDGYDDKNEVAEFLSPNPASGASLNWNKLVGGATVQDARKSAFTAPVQAPAPIQAPAQAAKPSASSTPPWLKKANTDTNNPF
jgi:hypothetical protein